MATRKFKTTPEAHIRVLLDSTRSGNLCGSCQRGGCVGRGLESPELVGGAAHDSYESKNPDGAPVKRRESERKKPKKDPA